MPPLDTLTRLAVLGTARGPGLDIDDDTFAARVAAALEKEPVERRLLLTAGSRAVAEAAARIAARPEIEVERAPVDDQPTCSARAAAALLELLRGQHAELLPEALDRLARAKQRLPPALLPIALRSSRADVHERLGAVLGARGAWLAKQNPAWAKLLAPEVMDLEKTWNEGSPDERRAALKRLRETDAAKGRAWLEATWPQENAEQRERLIAELEGALGPADEPFLEAARKDRASGVRAAACGLLAKLPGSAFLQRMCERADAALSWKAAGGGAIEVDVADKLDAEAERDGIDKPPRGTGKKDHYLTRVLSVVPLAHWEARFSAAPQAILKAVARSDHAGAIAIAMSRAAALGAAPAWSDALFSFWEQCDDKTVAAGLRESSASAVLASLPASSRAAHATLVLRGARKLPSIGLSIAHVAVPWPDDVAVTFVAVARHELFTAGQRASALVAELPRAALALPSASLASVLDSPLELAPSLSYFTPAVARFSELAAARRTLHEEIAL